MIVEVIKPFGKQELGKVIPLSKDLAEKNIKLKRVKETTKKLPKSENTEPSEEKKQVFYTRKSELDKHPEFKHKLSFDTDEEKYNKILENLNAWKVKNNIE